MTRRLPLTLMVLLLALVPCAPARADATPPTVTVPKGIPIQVDGNVTATEWAKATTLEVGEGGATLKVAQFRGTLLLAFETQDAWIEGDELLLTFLADGAPEDLGAWSKGAVSIRYEPLKHDRAHLIVNRSEAMAVVPYDDQVVARGRFPTYACSVELALPLAFLGLEAGKERPVRFQVIRVRPGAGPTIATWPAGLDVGARPGTHPPDMKQSVRWGRLLGLTQAGGPGAISKTAWKALLVEQDEITRRGREAHVLMREMVEERMSFRKQNTLVDEQIFGNLAWIAEREPLADVDRLLMAKAHRMVNRYDEALAVLDALAGARRKATTNRALYERALTYRDMERFTDEAATWEQLARSAGMAMTRRQYELQAKQARSLLEAWNAEAEARAHDAARTDTPLVEVTTNRGRFLVQLFPDDTPKAAAHFLSMVKEGFYDGLRWHRALAGYIVQVGDPTTKDGDCSLAGKVEGDRKVDVEQNERRKPWRGALCFARKPGLYSNGSHVFVMTGPRPDLVDDSGVPFTLFGWVVSGMDVVDRLEWCDTLVRARVLYEPPAKAKRAEDGQDETPEDK
ncbi:MAG: peptidylprolyl isomerase [Planctomycetota bacterium]|nr:peptidylprolyl isomerase [Planctomycetota bacterium]